MATFSLQSILESEFMKFCAAPTDAQVKCFVDGLTSHEDFEEPPVWGDDPAGWLRSHLSTPDWYAGLTDDEMVAWDAGIYALVYRDEFEMKHHGFHCAVGDMFIELAAKAYAKRNEDAVVRRFWPHRYFDNYHPEVEPIDRRYFPCHAMLTNEQVGRLLKEVEDYDSLLATIAQENAHFVERWREPIAADIEEAMPALREIYEQKRMWYSMFDF